MKGLMWGAIWCNAIFSLLKNGDGYLAPLVGLVAIMHLLTLGHAEARSGK